MKRIIILLSILPVLTIIAFVSYMIVIKPSWYTYTPYKKEYIPKLASAPAPYSGSYVPLSPLVLTYKDYKGTPSIDDPEFEAISLEKGKYGSCSWSYTKYSASNPIFVYLLAIFNNEEAAYEIWQRGGDGFLDLIRDDYGSSNILYAIDSTSDVKKLDDFSYSSEAIASKALLTKVLLFRSKRWGDPLPENINEDYFNTTINSVAKNNYSRGLSYAYEYTKDKDLFCEAYFRGCYVSLADKAENNIKCDNGGVE